MTKTTGSNAQAWLANEATPLGPRSIRSRLWTGVIS